MDALILSCGTGGGHNAAGRALEQELTARGHTATFLDPYTLRGHGTSAAVNNTYISVAQRAPGVFGFVYSLGAAYRRLPVKSPVYHANRAMVPLLEKYLDGHPCDAIVTTHLFPAEILTNMKARGLTVPPTVFIATDYTCIPFTEETDCDRYVIPSPDLTDEFASRGIPREKLLPLGIPVCREFGPGPDRAQIRASLGLRPDERFILAAGGSIGAGKLRKAVGILSERFPDARLAAICGNNRQLYEDLRRKYGDRCTVLEHTDRFAELMRACDVLVSKPGGLSSTEAANLGTALVHLTPIPGCETRNMDFFASRGMSLPVRDPGRELTAACEKLLDSSARAEMAECQRGHISRTSARDVCGVLESLASAESAFS